MKNIPYSQVLRPNQICSRNDFFDIRCDNLGKWLPETGQSEKFVRKRILKARLFLKETLLDKGEVFHRMIEL